MDNKFIYESPDGQTIYKRRKFHNKKEEDKKEEDKKEEDKTNKFLYSNNSANNVSNNFSILREM
tara:strand:+ start:463 stop:654 length:192 start_codon:yes stop_codon:yes gene_type:complete